MSGTRRAPGYAPDRVQQLRLLLWVAAGSATLLVLAAALTNLFVLLPPGVVLLVLAVCSLVLLTRGAPAARPVIAATAVVAILIGLLLSRSGVGLLFAVIGVPLLLIAVLPGRDEPPSPPAG